MRNVPRDPGSQIFAHLVQVLLEINCEGLPNPQLHS
jgi:hypothetical protein